MKDTLRQLVVLALFLAAGYGVFRLVQDRRAPGQQPAATAPCPCCPDGKCKDGVCPVCPKPMPKVSALPCNCGYGCSCGEDGVCAHPSTCPNVH